MDSGDVVSIVFVVLIVGSLVLPWIRGLVNPGAGENGRVASAGPKSFAESGGYRPVARRQVQTQMPVPIEQRRQVEFENQEAVLPERGEARLAREEAIERSSPTDFQETAEERTRRRPIAPLIVVTRETVDAGQVRLQFGNPQAVRNAIIMREVLDRPVGLREEN
jgi:hypothetical protein